MQKLIPKMNKIVPIMVIVIIITGGFCSFAQSIQETPFSKSISFEDVKSNDGSIPEKDFFYEKEMAMIGDMHEIEGVPAYSWHHGCAPTAAGMVMGYWDMHGFDNLVDGSSYEQTNSVNQMIASDEHYQDYSLPIDTADNILPDKSEDPVGDEHQDNCVADFMKTSRSRYNLWYGCTLFKYVNNAMKEYIEYKNNDYVGLVETTSVDSTPLTWEVYCEEIANDHPIVLLIDTNGDGITNHFVTAVGYWEDYNGLNLYGIHDTLYNFSRWFEFHEIKKGEPMGIYGGVLCSLTHKPNKPTIDGTTSGKIKEPQMYTAITEDPENEDIYYFFDWGDNTSGDWVGPYASGEMCEVCHTWMKKGTYQVIVKAKDVNGAESEWSQPLTVNMPKSKKSLETLKVYDDPLNNGVILMVAFPTEFDENETHFTFMCPGRGWGFWITPEGCRYNTFCGFIIEKEKFFGMANSFIVIGMKVR
jgi:hypothetical protein